MSLALIALVSGVGDWVALLAVENSIAFVHGAPMYVISLIGLSNILPLILVGPFATRLVHAHRPLTVLVVAQAYLLVVASLFYFAPSYAYYFVLLFLLGLGVGLTRAAIPKLIRALFGREGTNQANSLMEIGEQVSKVAGPAAGGLVVSNLGVRASYLVNAASFGVAGAVGLVVGAVRGQSRASDPSGSEADSESIAQALSLREQFALLRRNNFVMRSVFAVAGVLFLVNMADALSLIYLRQAHLGTVVSLSELVTALSIGGIAGALVAMFWGRRSPLLAPAGAVVVGLSLATFWAFPHIVPIIGASLGAGIGSSLFIVSAISRQQAALPEHLLAAYGGARTTANSSAQLLSWIVSGVVGSLEPARLVFLACGVAMAVVAGFMTTIHPEPAEVVAAQEGR